ncbi:MAG: hypothetical protein FE78DRAFT_90871 [Acidomyces sp. 'richmondensis']|nr:MAG: hypothetical protein FE78DRAFT_90871 [Acidomyces sp. 'richmondensis']
MPPPKRVQTSLNEGYILLAISAFQLGQFHLILAAAHTYSIDRTTIYRRIRGQPSREAYRPTNMRLTKTEEKASTFIKRTLEIEIRLGRIYNC